MPGIQVDGNDLHAVRDAVSMAAKRARRGDGPTLIECMTFRMRGHEEASGIEYVPESLRVKWSKNDPIARFEKRRSMTVFCRGRRLSTYERPS